MQNSSRTVSMGHCVATAGGLARVRASLLRRSGRSGVGKSHRWGTDAASGTVHSP